MSEQNPVLNNPYEEPTLHYATNLQGELDYSREKNGRRVFSPEIQSIPVRQGPQSDLEGLHDAESEYGSHIVNLLRREVGQWRGADYPQTTRITRELIQFWFCNPERDRTHSLFFAQREAIETAIWLNEVAEKSNVGQHILRQLADANESVSEQSANQLPRTAFKMATGTGKTVVMACLIVYHFFNRREYRQDTRFADNFLLVAPGVTIRERLGVLRVDTRTGIDNEDYYHVRYLVPTAWRKELSHLNSRLVITNYHAFEPKTIQGNKKSPFDGKINDAGKKSEAREDFGQVTKRLMSGFKAGSRLLILNDEAHHCYLPREDTRKAEGEETKEENARAAVWFTGLTRIARRFRVRHVYDLSATPYYLTGSGYDPYSLFPWVVSDFGLIEAVESGLVKIPFLPAADDTQEIDLPVLRNLYEHLRDSNALPKAGRKRQRARAKEKGEVLKEEPPRIPDLLKSALAQFYRHYSEEYQSRRHSAAALGTDQLEFADSPPVFIVVCNNTSVSKEVFKYLAGYEYPSEEADAPAIRKPGVYDLFSNFDPDTLEPRSRPPSLLIDSDALENSGQIDAEFKRVFASEIEQFRRDYARVHGQGAAENITDAEILREAINTVGRRGALGAHVRCVVSVSMLTEGWDANTVTHVCGIRRFGSQLLCEQVAGRALRRRSYFLAPYDRKTGEQLPQNTRRQKDVIWKFPPEYAHIIGVPFKLFKGGQTVAPPPVDMTRVRALPDREDECAIEFPNVDSYRIDYPDGPLEADLAAVEEYLVDGAKLPTKTVMATAVSGEEFELSVEDVLETREQQIVYRIAKDLLRDHFSDDDGNPQFHRFHELTAIVGDWYRLKVRVLGRDERWKKLLYFHDPKPLVAHVARAIKPGDSPEERIRPILNYYNPTGSSRFIFGQTSRETYETRHSHANVVVIDSGWEGKVGKTLDDMAEEGVIETWVKNAFLDFRIPYTDKYGKEREYQPDFIIRGNDPTDATLHLIVEVTGARHDKQEKTWTVRNRWLPAINAVREQHNWPRWDFLELAEETAVADARNLITSRFERHPGNVWEAREHYIAKHGPFTEDFDIPRNPVDLERWGVNPLDE